MGGSQRLGLAAVVAFAVSVLAVTGSGLAEAGGETPRGAQASPGGPSFVHGPGFGVVVDRACADSSPDIGVNLSCSVVDRGEESPSRGAGSAADGDIETPGGRACFHPTQKAQCRRIAVSGTGDARATDSSPFLQHHSLAVTVTGDAWGDTAVSGTGNASGPSAVSGTGRASGGIVASGTGNASGEAAISGAGDPEGHVLEAGGTGDADGRFALSAIGDARGDVAVSGTGDARGSLLAASGTGEAEGCQQASGTDETGRESHPPIRIDGERGPQGIVVGQDPATGEPIYRPGSGVTDGRGTAQDPHVIEGWCILPPR